MLKVFPFYTSVIGNLKYNDFDPISSSIEIGRRTFECLVQKHKGKFYPNVRLKESLQHLWKEMGSETPKSWKEISDVLKNSKIKYRVSLEDCLDNLRDVFSMDCSKSRISLYKF